MPVVTLPTLHAGQVAAYKALQTHRYKAVRCGRRFGKDVLMVTVAANRAAKGGAAGLFAPEHKQLTEPYDALEEILGPIKAKRGSSRSEGRIKTTTGGVVDFWPLNDNPLAGRGREYDDVLINEAAFTKRPQMLDTWRKAIRPTLLVRGGKAWVFSTPNGIDEEDFFYRVCNDRGEKSEYRDFQEFHAPTSANPLILPEEIERERQINHPLVFKQEFLAEFVDWSGVQFFELAKMLGEDGKPVPWPERCDAVFAVIDTAVKAGKQHDGTAIIYFGVDRFLPYRLVILDYDKIQIEGSLLESWLPTVYQRLEVLAKACQARQGQLGAYIEDKASGTILLQQAARRGWPAMPIDSLLTAAGKDERAISVSGYVYQGLVKISAPAYDKTITFKGVTRNHLLVEVLGFRVGDKDAYKRADDLLDCFTYGVSLALGNRDGY